MLTENDDVLIATLREIITTSHNKLSVGNINKNVLACVTKFFKGLDLV